MGERAQQWARVQLRGCAVGILGFLLFFFLVGISASNDFESDPSSPISSGALAKIFIIPICVVLGILLFKVAGPLFGGSQRAARSQKFQDLARERITDDRYRSGDAIRNSYVVVVVGLIIVVTGIAREDGSQGLIGAVICVVALRYAGRLRSERAAAKLLGAKTFSDDVADSVSTAAEVAGAAVTALGSFTVETARKTVDAVRAALKERENMEISAKSVGGSPDDPFVKVLSFLQESFQNHVDVLRSPQARAGFTAVPRPVSTGRQLLVNSEAAARSGQFSESKRLLDRSILMFDAGTIHPDSAEWPIDGPEVGRGHACMWGGIARVLSHLQPASPAGLDATLADAWFAAGVLIFLETGETVMAGRCAQELAESRRYLSDFAGANTFFLVSAYLFEAARLPDRARIASGRAVATTEVEVDSSFFLGRPPTEAEASKLTTVLGGRNSRAFYRMLG